jgi:DNA-binding NarL/FixJ family response regulator
MTDRSSRAALCGGVTARSIEELLFPGAVGVVVEGFAADDCLLVVRAFEQAPSPTPRMPLLEALPPTLIVQRVQQRHELINRLLDNGYSLSEVARRVGLDRKTARRYRDTRSTF